MTDQKKNQNKFDKRAANLRANLLKRKEQMRKLKDDQKEPDINQDKETD